MQVNFVERNGGPERLICEAEITFDDDGLLAGMKLVGFSLWRCPDGAVYVTFPSRAFGAGQERRYFDFLRPADTVGDGAAAKRTKAAIVDAWRVAGGQ